jgi:uncharacterized protein (DUF1330 family)
MPKGYRKDNGKPIGYCNKGRPSPRKNGRYNKCQQCKKLFYVIKCRINQRKFCSRKCFNHSLMGKPGKNQGSNNGNWKGGKHKNYHGYIIVLNKSHPSCDINGYIKQSHLVIEKHIGRYLKSEEVVHHINRNPSDDRIENLKLFPNNNEHIRFHRLNY